MERITVLHLQPGSQTARRLAIEPRVAEYNALVDGEIDGLTLHGAGVVYINDHGKEQRQARNVAAELLFEAAGQQLLPGDVLLGPVVVTGGWGPMGEDTSIDERVLALCARAGIAVVDE